MKLKELDKSLVGKSAFIVCSNKENIVYIFAIDISDAYYSNNDFGDMLIADCFLFEIPKKYKAGDNVYDIWKSDSWFFPNNQDERFEHIEYAEFEFMEKEEVIEKLHSFVDSILLKKPIKKYAVIK